jgi:hypothetical protein
MSISENYEGEITPIRSNISRFSRGTVDKWIQTVPGRTWFVGFRFYAPLEPYFDKSWPLPDVERVK